MPLQQKKINSTENYFALRTLCSDVFLIRTTNFTCIRQYGVK